MHSYIAQTFNIPALEGISPKSIEEHLGLYQGYVKNFNAISASIEDLLKNTERNAHAISELIRRKSFEFDGMRLHEYYFAQWEDGANPITSSGALAKALAVQFGSVDVAITHIRETGKIRGPGWSILYFDPVVSTFHIGFSGEQHQGHFITLPIILALDVWEHAFILDYGAQGKGKYIDAFFKNLNWAVMEKRFEDAQS